MQCDRLREAISARIDGEAPGLPDSALDAHLGVCDGCRGWQQRAHAVTRRTRLGGLFLDHDLAPKVIAAASAVATRRGRRFIQQAGPAAMAAVQLAVAMPLLLLRRGRSADHAALPGGSDDGAASAGEGSPEEVALTAAPEAGRLPAGRQPAPGGETTAAAQEVALSGGGMACAACAVRIEKKLNRLDEVRATVNYATASLRVTAPVVMPVAELIAAARQAGYTARPALEASSAPAGEPVRLGQRRPTGT